MTTGYLGTALTEDISKRNKDSGTQLLVALQGASTATPETCEGIRLGEMVFASDKLLAACKRDATKASLRPPLQP